MVKVPHDFDGNIDRFDEESEIAPESLPPPATGDHPLRSALPPLAEKSLPQNHATDGLILARSSDWRDVASVG